MHKVLRRTIVVVAIAQSFCFLVHSRLHANDVFLVQSLDFLVDLLPDNEPARPASRFMGPAVEAHPYAVVADAEVYVIQSEDQENGSTDWKVAIRAGSTDTLHGTLFWPDGAGQLRRFPAHVEMSDASADARDEFLAAKIKHYERLLQLDGPGAAWYRHQIRTAQFELGIKPSETEFNRQFFGNRGNSLSDTYALLSGGRALSESMQLETVAEVTEATSASVDLDSIRGLRKRAFKWDSLVEDLSPEIDPLANLIPDDQHALFINDFGSLTALAESISQHGVPILNLAEPRSEELRLQQRYERQLGLSLENAKLLDRTMIQSVAMTSSDPYFRTGTDFALLLETKNPNIIKRLIDAHVLTAAKQFPEAKTDSGAVGGVEYRKASTPDRSLSSYTAVLGNSVVVTNSYAQLSRLVDTFEQRREALATLPEYQFARHQYPRDESETGFLIVSEKTFRRWCSPRWRIASSRRTRAVAVMAEAQASFLNQIVSRELVSGSISTPGVAPAAGEMELRSAGVHSSSFGTLAFQTPISEMKFDQVTPQEQELYEAWRSDFEKARFNFSDSIAIQFKISDLELAADFTVMPVNKRSDYRTLLELSQGSKVGDLASDPHSGTLLHLALAINRNSSVAKRYAGLVAILYPQIKVNLRSWIGDTLTLYVDDGQFFADLSQVAPDEFEDHLQENLGKLPIALQVDVENGENLRTFLANIRSMIERDRPGDTRWEALEYKGHKYTRLSASDRIREMERGNTFQHVSLFVEASDDVLVLTLNESVLKRSIDRREARREAEAAGEEWPRPGIAWIGDSLNVQVDAALLSYVEKPLQDFYQRSMQALCWKNIMILNEWKRLYPNEDPVKFHETYWNRHLVCPGGGRYRWNEDWQTMESTVFGHPGQPKDGPAWPAALARLSHGNFGITFKDDGLRAKIRIHRK